MADAKEYDEKQAREAIARALMQDGPTAAAPSAAAAAPSGINPAQLFCQNWDTVKQVLQFLKPHLPIFIRGVVDAIIKAGDVLKGIVCH
jgi:hypothetical protein